MSSIPELAPRPFGHQTGGCVGIPSEHGRALRKYGVPLPLPVLYRLNTIDRAGIDRIRAKQAAENARWRAELARREREDAMAAEYEARRWPA